jgi:hypothetical protein
LVLVSLTEWIDEYRRVDPNDVNRPKVDSVDDWEEPDLLAPVDRVRDTEPRWMDRARSVGYARATQL